MARLLLERPWCVLIAAVAVACGNGATSVGQMISVGNDAADASAPDVVSDERYVAADVSRDAPGDAGEASPDTPSDAPWQLCGSERCSPSQACIYQGCCRNCSLPDGGPTCAPGTLCPPPPGGCAADETWGFCPVGGFAACVGPCVPYGPPFCMDLEPQCASDPCHCDPDIVLRGCHDYGSCTRGPDGQVEVRCVSCY